MPTSERDWDLRYQQGDSPWDSGLASRELIRVIEEVPIEPCRAIELGCGTGTNAVELGRRGFAVAAVDWSPAALAHARSNAEQAGLGIDFIESDVLDLPPAPAFDFVFDRGCYHCVRRIDPAGFLDVLGRITRPGSRYLMLAGNADETPADGDNMPRLRESDIREELGAVFSFDWIRPFRFQDRGGARGPLGWSCLMTRAG